ncbi:hypothetical protein CAC42_6510 [Sphaceloma murrayae]|uniref:Uncharacterized protein n=1 Tax=Sphaceloma murrayae TaxID=2082308 RepID=A0A2K1QFR2_9PEZI|nr:hypothetical protein CAC42_6510 [Sphaceloma murrayae]
MDLAQIDAGNARYCDAIDEISATMPEQSGSSDTQTSTQPSDPFSAPNTSAELKPVDSGSWPADFNDLVDLNPTAEATDLQIFGSSDEQPNKKSSSEAMETSTLAPNSGSNDMALLDNTPPQDMQQSSSPSNSGGIDPALFDTTPAQDMSQSSPPSASGSQGTDPAQTSKPEDIVESSLLPEPGSSGMLQAQSTAPSGVQTASRPADSGSAGVDQSQPMAPWDMAMPYPPLNPGGMGMVAAPMPSHATMQMSATFAQPGAYGAHPYQLACAHYHDQPAPDYQAVANPGMPQHPDYQFAVAPQMQQHLHYQAPPHFEPATAFQMPPHQQYWPQQYQLQADYQDPAFFQTQQPRGGIPCTSARYGRSPVVQQTTFLTTAAESIRPIQMAQSAGQVSGIGLNPWASQAIHHDAAPARKRRNAREMEEDERRAKREGRANTRRNARTQHHKATRARVSSRQQQQQQHQQQQAPSVQDQISPELDQFSQPQPQPQQNQVAGAEYQPMDLTGAQPVPTSGQTQGGSGEPVETRLARAFGVEFSNLA